MARRKPTKKWGKIGSPHSAERKAHLNRIRPKGRKKATRKKRR